MKKIEKFSELPAEAIKFFGIEGEEDDLTWEEWEDELIYIVKDSVGYSDKPKKERIGQDDYLVHSFELKLENDVTIVAQRKQYIKEIDFICDEEDHGLYIK